MPCRIIGVSCQWHAPRALTVQTVGSLSCSKMRHTSTINDKVAILGETMGEAIKSGQRVRDLYAQAEQTHMHRDDAMALLFKLFPDPVEKDGKKPAQASKTRAENKRKEALVAANMGINRVGERGNAATLWNAATFLVDRTTNGNFRKTRGGDRLDSMLFGSRADRVSQIEKVMIQVLQSDGTEVSMSVDQAIGAGIPTSQIGGKTLIDDILADMNN